MRGRPKTTWTHPVLVRHQEERSRNLQDRIADAITSFAGSMPFVYLHVIWFSLWIALRVEKFPFGFLTMLVSLEAIFLSTFVMISQNRADEKRAALAEHQWQIVQSEEKQNEELLTISGRSWTSRNRSIRSREVRRRDQPDRRAGPGA